MNRTIFVLIIFMLLVLTMSSQEIRINEFMSSNATVLQDSDGDYSDWIEFYNRGEVAVNLRDFMITDDTLEPDKWIFPEMTLLPKTYLLIFASDKDRHDTLELHTNFKINADGEYLMLSDPDGNRVDLTPAVPVATDHTYGRFPDGNDQLVYLGVPTPGRPNVSGNTLAMSKAPGFYKEPFKIGLSTGNAFDRIYYTLNGGVPDTSSLIYSDSIAVFNADTLPNIYSTIPTSPPFLNDHFRKWYPPQGNVQKAIVIRAVAYNGGNYTSNVVTGTYFVDPEIATKFNYPVISITTDSLNLFDYETGIYIPGVHLDTLYPDWTGNYYQKGDDWERPAHLEYFSEDGTREINQGVGVRIHGKITRHAPQKTLRVYARSEYGASYFNYPLMINSSQDKYKRFLLRSSYSDGGQTIFRDDMTHDLVNHLDLELMHYRPVVVFINGEYWGIQTIRDRIDKYALALKYDIDPDSIDLLSDNAIIEEGSNEDYLNMLDYIQNHDMSVKEHYDHIKTRMDINNYIDYQIVEIYFNNTDWPGSNVSYWRQQKPGAKWRWILYDLDNCYYDPAFNTLSFATFDGDTSWQNPSWSTFLFRNLLKSDEFKDQFIDRFAQLLNTTFQPDTILARIDYFTEMYEKGIDFHINRWSFPRSHEGWLGDIDYNIVTFVNERPCLMRDFILDYFDLEEDEFDFHCGEGEDEHPQNELIIVPNPAVDRFKICLPGLADTNYNIVIFDETGRLVMKNEMEFYHGTSQESIDVTHLREGFYFVHLFNDAEIHTQKFIKTFH